MKPKIVKWIRGRIKEARAKGVVLGLSGGLDSSVVAALAKEAVGKKRLLALIMPCGSSPADLRDARVIAKRLGIKTKLVDLSKIYGDFLKILPAAGKLAVYNLKPRLRMITLYYFANKLNYLVCGTGNKSELMTGYFTKFGDGGVDMLPLGGLLKTQVKKLAEELKIPRRIIEKAPSAGLWQGQTDEGEMGISYCELDDILERMEKNEKQILSKNKIDKVKAVIKGSGHKRQGPRICYI